MFENYKNCLFNDEVILRSQQRFKRDYHNMYTQEVNKVASRSRDNKRLQTFNKTESYPHGKNAFKMCEIEMKKKILKRGQVG